MSVFSSYKKIFMLGFILVILVAIPFSVYVAQKRQQTTSKAVASTTLSLEPSSPTINIGDTLVLNIMIDPGTNQVSFVKLAISFDASKFTNANFTVNSDPSTNTLNTPVDTAQYDNTAGKASMSLSIGSDPTKAVKVKTKIATLQLKATAATTPTNPNVTFDPAPNTQVLSIASPDYANENVLSTAIPAKVTVTSAAGGITVTPTSTPTLTPTPTSTSTSTTTPTTSGSAPTSAPGPGGNISSALICSSLEINGLANGVAPYPLTFTATGSVSSGTISKISFNFGDAIEDLTSGGGIGTSTVSAQIMHTYNTPGIYTAYAILTDSNGNLSSQQDICTKTITVSSTALAGQPNPSIVPLPPTGDGKIMLGLGAAGIVFVIIGAALLFL